MLDKYETRGECYVKPREVWIESENQHQDPACRGRVNAVSHVKSDHRTVFILSLHLSSQYRDLGTILNLLWALRYSDIRGRILSNQNRVSGVTDQSEQGMAPASIHQEETIILWCCILKEDAVKIFYPTGNSFVNQDLHYSMNNLFVGLKDYFVVDANISLLSPQ